MQTVSVIASQTTAVEASGVSTLKFPHSLTGDHISYIVHLPA